MLCFVILNIHLKLDQMILKFSIYANARSINIIYIAGLEKFKSHNRLTICDEVIKLLLDILEVVGIIKKWVFGSSKLMENILKMAHRNDIVVDVINEISIMEDSRNKRYQTSRYRVRKNGAHSVHYY